MSTRVAVPRAAAEAHAAEAAHRARSSSLLIAVTAAVVVPAWSGFDVAVEPQHARAFVTLRLLCSVPVLLATVLLWRRPPARPERVALGVLVVVQTEIAWMVSRADSSRELYLLGFTLALYGSGLLLHGSHRGTVLLSGLTLSAFAAFSLTAPDAMTAREAIGALTYLGTASIIAVLSHLQRQRMTQREAAIRASLEREEAHSRALLERVERLSREDPLTGLANRRCWDDALAVACARAAAHDEDLCVVLLDLDRFKAINDSVGHTGGDAALRWVAQVMVERAPERALVARLGGDELAMLVPAASGAAVAALAERVRRDVRLRRVPDARGVRVSVSQGVAAAHGEAATPAELMRAADRALYQAKRTRDAVALAGEPPAAIPAPRAEGSGVRA